MGGAAGHLSHLHEDLSLTFGEIKNILKTVASGKLEVVEKVDGQNIFFTYDTTTDSLKVARNKGDIAAGGMSESELAAKFSGHPAENAFTEGFRAIKSALASIPKEDLIEIFGEDSGAYINAEIMYPANPNIINYNGNYIVMHGLQQLKGKPLPSSEKSFSKLVSAVNSFQTSSDKTSWSIVGPQIIPLKKIADGTVYNKLVSDLSSAAPGASDGTTLGQFVRQQLLDGQVNSLPLADKQKQQLADIIIDSPEAIGLKDFKKNTPKSLHKLISQLATKVNRYKVISKVLFPVEKVISDFAIEVLKGMQSLFVTDHDEEITRMRQEVESAIEVLKQSQGSSETIQASLDKQLAKLGSIENIASTLEGVVFEYPPGSKKLYKLTGAFAMANQIIGRARRMPKEETVEEAVLRKYVRSWIGVMG